MKTIVLRSILTFLATLPVTSVAMAAQNKLQMMDDFRLVEGRIRVSQDTQGRGGISSDAVEKLIAKGLIENDVAELPSPSPSAHG